MSVVWFIFFIIYIGGVARCTRSAIYFFPTYLQDELLKRLSEKDFLEVLRYVKKRLIKTLRAASKSEEFIEECKRELDKHAEQRCTENIKKLYMQYVTQVILLWPYYLWKYKP